MPKSLEIKLIPYQHKKVKLIDLRVNKQIQLSSDLFICQGAMVAGKVVNVSLNEWQAEFSNTFN